MKQCIEGTTRQESKSAIGPVFVEDAVEGDLLVVHIDRIRDFALSAQISHFGSLTGESPVYAQLN